ncbi:RNA degradosome polyphosphate kinase [Actinomycetota bacterium]
MSDPSAAQDPQPAEHGTDLDVSITSAHPQDNTRFRPRDAEGRFVRLHRADSGQSEDGLLRDRFLDREISWLQFNERVLQLAGDQSVPLLERARFLAIFASNLDEFFMVRVAGLKRRIATGMAVRSASGLEPREVLEQISLVAHELMEIQTRLFTEQIRPALEAEDIHIVHWSDLSEEEQTRLTAVYAEQIFPVLTPLAVDPAHPFPYISGLSLNLAVVLANPKTGKEHFARVKVPPALSRFLRVDDGHDDDVADLYRVRFVPLEEVIAAHLDMLFPGMEVRQHFTFRVTRNEDLEVEEDDAENLLAALEKELIRRRFGPPVRLEVQEGMDAGVHDLLVRELGVHRSEVYTLPLPLDLRGLNVIADLDRSDLHYPRFVPRTNADLAPEESAQAQDIFATLRRGDVLLHHPYDSFATSVQAFLSQAAADPRVLAIKQTLYRTSGDSPIIDALIEAAEAGKQVLAIVEIKARFDEENNITWARKLEHAGVHVVYGIVGLKTHAKLSLVVRQEPQGLRRYCHIGTGNYNPKTARIYEDFGLLTGDPEVAGDLGRLFNQLSGLAPESRFDRLLVAPHSLRKGLVKRIRAQADRAAKGKSAYVGIKVNSMVDEEVIDALYRASQAGVPIDIWVRGICAVRPGVEGLSETITVRSVLGRFLEHSRVFVFGEPGDDEVWIGSADMMHRNLDRRVESLVQLKDPRTIEQVRGVMDRGRSGDYAHWTLAGDGRWVRHRTGPEGTPLPDIQQSLIDMYAARRRKRRS